jgi:hypothetical protein
MSKMASHETTPPAHPALKLVTDRFEQVRDRAVRAFASDPDFRYLCDEYQACVVTVARLQAGPGSTATLRSEYGALLLRLEHELLRHLEEHPDREES